MSCSQQAVSVRCARTFGVRRCGQTASEWAGRVHSAPATSETDSDSPWDVFATGDPGGEPFPGFCVSRDSRSRTFAPGTPDRWSFTGWTHGPPRSERHHFRPLSSQSESTPRRCPLGKGNLPGRWLCCQRPLESPRSRLIVSKRSRPEPVPRVWDRPAARGRHKTSPD